MNMQIISISEVKNIQGEASLDEINAIIVAKIEIVLFYILQCNIFLSFI